MDYIDEVHEVLQIGVIVAIYLLQTGRVLAAVDLLKECLFLLKTKALEIEKKPLALIRDCIYLYLTIGYVRVKDHTNAMESGREFLVLARRTGRRDLELKVTCKLAELHMLCGKYQEAKKLFLKALCVFKETGQRQGLITCYGNLGNVLSYLGECAEAKDCHEKALAIAKEIGDRFKVATCYGNLGNVYCYLGEHGRAKDYYERALSLTSRYDDMEEEASLFYSCLGNVLQSLDDNAKAYENHEKALKIAKDTGDRVKEAFCYGNLGRVFYSLGKHGKAVEYNEKAVAITKEIGDKNGEAFAYIRLGNVLRSTGEYFKAEEYLQKALVVIKEMNYGKKQATVACYNNLGTVCRSLGKYAKAKEYFENGLQVAEEIDDRKMKSSCCGSLGSVLHSLGEYAKSQEYAEKALAISSELGDRRREARDCGILAAVFHSLGECGKAKEHLEKALKIQKEIGDKAGEVTSYINFGELYRATGEYATAKDHLEKALVITNECGSYKKEKKAFCHGNRGKVFMCLGEPTRAKEHHEKALEIRKEIGLKQGEASDYVGLGAVFQIQGRYAEAKEYLETALEIQKETGQREGEAQGYIQLGVVFISLGEYDQAIECHDKALAIAKEIRHSVLEAKSYGLCGSVFLLRGEYAQVKKWLGQALEIAKETGDKGMEVSYYVQLGKLFQFLHEYSKAQENFEKALTMSKQMGMRIVEASSYGNLGTVFLSIGENAKAKQYYEKALSMSKETEWIENEMRTLGSLAMIMLLEGNIDEAKSSILVSIHKFEKILGLMTDTADHLKISLFDEHFRFYQFLSLLFCRTQNPDQALYAAELGRARALADLMSVQYSVQKQISDNPQTWRGIEIVMKNEHKCTCLYISYASHFILLWVIKADESIRLRITDVNTCFVDKVSLRSVDEMFGIEIVRQFHTLFQEKCEDRSWVSSVAKKDSLVANRLVGEDEDENQQPIPTLSECYNMIIAPVAEFLEEAEIVIVPDRCFFKVPFAALQDKNGKYLSESFRIRIVPSLTTLKLIHDSPGDYHSQTGALIVGDPDVGEVLYRGDVYKPPRLPFAEMEAEMIAQLLGAKALVGKQATKRAVLQSIDSTSLIHFAAHGNAERGEIALAPPPLVERKPQYPSGQGEKRTPNEEDYLLTMADISQVRLRAKLVVLSCCHSARGQIKAEGAVGIARAFLGSGARSVLVALWAIEDKATKQLMSRFYEHLVHGESASESLHQAMKWMRENGFSDVGQWAPFMLIGDDVSFDFQN